MTETPPQSSPEKATLPKSTKEWTPWSSLAYRLCEETINLREVNNRQHKLFEQALNKSRDSLQAAFNSFAADTQRAYQQLRQDLNGEKRLSMALLNELLEIGFDMKRIVFACPTLIDSHALARWAEGVAIKERKVQAALLRHGIHSYDAIVGSSYNPDSTNGLGAGEWKGWTHCGSQSKQNPVMPASNLNSF